jgi:hypothetical protein
VGCLTVIVEAGAKAEAPRAAGVVAVSVAAIEKGEALAL